MTRHDRNGRDASKARRREPARTAPMTLNQREKVRPYHGRTDITTNRNSTALAVKATAWRRCRARRRAQRRACHIEVIGLRRHRRNVISPARNRRISARELAWCLSTADEQKAHSECRRGIKMISSTRPISSKRRRCAYAICHRRRHKASICHQKSIVSIC